MWFWLSFNNGQIINEGDFKIQYILYWLLHFKMEFFFLSFSWCHFCDICEDYFDFNWDSILFSQQIIYNIR